MTAAHAEDRDVGMALIVFIGRGKIHRPLIAPGRGKELMRRRFDYRAGDASIHPDD